MICQIKTQLCTGGIKRRWSSGDGWKAFCHRPRLNQGLILKRVFLFVYPAEWRSCSAAVGTPPPLLREHRLYQGRLAAPVLQFQADELLTIERIFNELLDPKCGWAIRHLEFFPLKYRNGRSYTGQLASRTPGSDRNQPTRIVNARRYGRMDFHKSEEMGVVLKERTILSPVAENRSYHTPLEETYIHRDNWSA